MEALLELADVVTRNKVKQIRTLKTCDCKPKEKVHEFYELITSGAITTDQDAIELLGYQDKRDRAYRKLKSQLEERLLNSVVFIDVHQPDFSDAQKAFYTCQRYMAISRILLGRAARRPAIKLLEKVLSYADRLELSEAARDAAISLREHHAFRTGNSREFRKYMNLSNKYSEICRAEDEAVQYFQQFSIASVKSVQGENQALFEDIMARIHPHLIEINSFRFHLTVYLLKMKHYSQSSDHTQVIAVCSEALAFFKTKPMAPMTMVAVFKIRQLEAYINLDDFENARKVFRQCDRQLEQGIVHWYNAYELYILLLFRARKYQSIRPVFEKVLQSQSYKHQTAKRHETFRMYQSFLHYLRLMHKVKWEPTKEFRLRKFLNEIPIHSQDKRGYNVTVLIIQILILIQTRQYDDLTDRIEAIEKYTSRYLRNDENFRSNCFIKMLLQVPKRNFHKVAVLRHAKPYIEKLATVPLLKSKQSYEIEIIPYEHLWEYVLESLEAGQIKEPS